MTCRGVCKRLWVQLLRRRAPRSTSCARRPDGITVEFGVDLAVEAGAVITKSSANCHLKVTVAWRKNSPGHLDADEYSG
ncbi:CU044_2847 family protein [Streptomyces kaempferi]